MPVDIVNETYNGDNALTANANDWVDGEIKLSVRFAVGSSTQNLMSWKVQGSNFWFQIQQGDFGELGFLAGDAITVTYTFIAAPPPIQAQTFTFNVLSVQGNKLYVDTPFGLGGGGTFFHIDGRKFPTDAYVSSILIVANRAPASIEFEFNLAPNGTTLLNSMIDSEFNRFELPVVTGIPTGVPQLMTQFVNKSGGLFKDVDLTLTGTFAGGWRDYRIRYKFMQWGIIQDGFAEPNYYELADCLAPINKVKCFAQYGNPNGVLTDLSQNVEANTGGYDQNYNGGIVNYSSISTSWIDYLGDAIDRLDYSNTSTFIAVVEAPNQANPNSTYRMSLEWRPINGLFYLNKPTNLGENLLVIAPEVDFIADGVADPTIYQGYTDPSGARWDFQNLKFELTGVDELTITGDIIPNAQATILFDGVPDGGRKSTLAVSIGNYTSDGTIYSDRVRLKLFDEDNYDAPTKGVQIPNVIDESLLDHDGNEIITPNPQTTTEDDVLYISNFNLLDNVNYEGVRARKYAYNTVTEESFTLEDTFFSFANVVVTAGQFQPNFVNGRGFNLPPTSDRNQISLVRNPANDIPGQYGLTLEYGYLSRWEYWLSQTNVDNDFFDITQPFDGKNKNWQRFSGSGDWVVRLSYYTRLDGVDDFNDLEIGIRPYEDDINVSTTRTIFVPSLAISPTNLIGDEINELTVLMPWTIGTYTNAWAEVTIEDFESGNRWVLSSVLDQGNISANPLKPMAGQTGLELDFPAPSTARLRFIVDTNIVSANDVSLSYRIYSEDVAGGDGKRTTTGLLKKTTTGITKQKA